MRNIGIPSRLTVSPFRISYEHANCLHRAGRRPLLFFAVLVMREAANEVRQGLPAHRTCTCRQKRPQKHIHTEMLPSENVRRDMR
jgi:hypothetical protein